MITALPNLLSDCHAIASHNFSALDPKIVVNSLSHMKHVD